MSSSEDSSSDDDTVITYYYKYYKQKKIKRMWCHPYIERNINCRIFVAAKELEKSDSKFLAFYRMTKESYQILIDIVSPFIRQKDTLMRECVSAEERILITLRYLATGCSFTSLSFYFARGESTIGYVVYESIKIFWDVLRKSYMQIPTKQEWKKIADRFYSLWNILNCIGAVDGKHVRIEKLPNSGSSNFNYKGYHSIVLMACCNTDGLFTMIECGYAGRNSDGSIFRVSAIKYWLTHSGLDIPSPARLPNDINESLCPFYLVGDEAFPLSPYLMRPYSKRILDNTKRIFNYRLSQGRKTIECAFGIMCEKFQVLNSPIRCRDPEKINNIIKSVCVLYNFVRKREGIEYRISQHDENGTGGIAALHLQNDNMPNIEINTRSSANEIRNYLANYFITPQASLPWQWKYCI